MSSPNSSLAEAFFGRLDLFIHAIAQRQGSDLYLSPGKPLWFRNINGYLQNQLTDVTLASGGGEIFWDLFLTYLREELTQPQQERLRIYGDLDLSYTTIREPFVRCRIHIYRAVLGTAFDCPYSLNLRLFPTTIPTPQELHLPPSVQSLTNQTHGLLIFTGATGAGKTTSLASLLNVIHQTQRKHIITIEDPVEYVYPDGQSLVTQREVIRDTRDFATGLRAALREDPDILLIGEMRDPDTIRTALAAAESGHLVFSTLHAGNTMEACDRLTQYFDSHEQDAIRAQFANAFTAVVAQKLLPRRNGNGRVPAFEVLLQTDATQSLIRKNLAYQLPSYMNQGMNTMEQDVCRLKQKGLIA